MHPSPLPGQGLDVGPCEKLPELLRRFPLVHEDDEAVTRGEGVVDRPGRAGLLGEADEIVRSVGRNCVISRVWHAAVSAT
jgi:hypothetical protein